MYRKQVRRRRAVLALLIISSFALLTATFGERSGGLQNGVSAVLGPLQEGADRALKPARDLINWFDETFEARGENDRLQAEVEKYREQAVGAEVALQEDEQLQSAAGTEALRRDPLRLRGGRRPRHRPLAHRLVRDGSDRQGHERGHRGRRSGDRPGGPAGGLVGSVSSATAGDRQGDADHRPGRRERGHGEDRPRRAPRAWSAPRSATRTSSSSTSSTAPSGSRRGDEVVTAGWRSTEFSSRYPPNIPIGEVTEAPIALQEASQEVRMRPFADMRELDFIMVLTGGSR